MKPPNITAPPPPDQTQKSTQEPQPIMNEAIPLTKPNQTSQTITRAQGINTTQVQQAPLALTTQSQAQDRPPASQLPPQITIPVAQQSQPSTPQAQPKTQPQQTIQTAAPTIVSSTIGTQPIALATTTAPGQPTALVIIPQHSTAASMTPSKQATISAKPTAIQTTSVGLTPTHVTLAGTTQPASIQLQGPIPTHVSNATPVPMAAHQQSTSIVTTPSALANRPPTILPVVPIAPSTVVKSEPNKYICCLLDNGVRCDRVAGNASFSARIQKIVGTKKMNFALDPSVRHAYICEHHKALLTVAKKSTALSRDTKSNARSYTANNNANTLASQNNSSFNDISIRQQNLQHPVNLALTTNSGNRPVNNHTGALNNLTVRQGPQIPYGRYPAGRPNQLGNMDVMMAGNFDSTGGDILPSSSGGIDVDLQQLQVNTLRRYKRHFRVQTKPGLNKIQLAESLKNHFRTLPIIEKEAITYFVYIVKCYRNKLDHNPKAE